jgi:hypothetical protein
MEDDIKARQDKLDAEKKVGQTWKRLMEW